LLNSSNDIVAVVSINANTTYYFAAVYDRDENLTLYLVEYGQNIGSPATVDISSMATDNIDNSFNFAIGRFNNIDFQYFSGEISAIRYSSKALTEQEIKESYGLAKGWTWDGVGSVRNDNFRQVVSNGGTTTSRTMYKKSATTNDTTTVSYINEDNHTITLGDGTHDNISIRPVLNAVQPANFVEDFSKGGARYIEITAENQGTQSTSQIYANSTMTNYYWGDGSSAEVIGDFRVTNGNHGIMMNNLADDQPTHPAAWKFNGIDQYVNFGNVCNVGAHDFILFAWVCSSNIEYDWRDVISKNETDGEKSFWFGQHSVNGAFRFGIYSDGSTEINLDTDANFITNNEWVFVACVFDGHYQKIYRNGSLYAQSVDLSGTSVHTGTSHLMIGGKSYGNNWYGEIGLSGIYIFDGQDGAPNDLTESMEKWLIKEIYNITDGLYLQE